MLWFVVGLVLGLVLGAVAVLWWLGVFQAWPY